MNWTARLRMGRFLPRITESFLFLGWHQKGGLIKCLIQPCPLDTSVRYDNVCRAGFMPADLTPHGLTLELPVSHQNQTPSRPSCPLS